MKRKECELCCTGSSAILQMGCGSFLCEQCIFNWTKSWLSNRCIPNKTLVPCPFDNCNQRMPIENYIGLMSSKNAKEINKYSPKLYFSQQRGIQDSHQNNCESASITGKLAKGIIWFFSSLGIYLASCLCPDCNTHTCSLQTLNRGFCSKWKKYFCWNCYNDYDHSNIRGIPCSLRTTYLKLYTICFIFLMQPKSISINFDRRQLFDNLSWYINRLALALVDYALIYLAINIPMTFMRDILRWRLDNMPKNISFAFICILCFLIPFAYNYYLYKHSLLWEIIIFVFDLCLLILCIVGAFRYAAFALGKPSYGQFIDTFINLTISILSLAVFFWYFCGFNLSYITFNGLGFLLILIVQKNYCFPSPNLREKQELTAKVLFVITILYLIILSVFELISVWNNIVMLGSFISACHWLKVNEKFIVLISFPAFSVICLRSLVYTQNIAN